MLRRILELVFCRIPELVVCRVPELVEADGAKLDEVAVDAAAVVLVVAAALDVIVLCDVIVGAGIFRANAMLLRELSRASRLQEMKPVFWRQSVSRLFKTIEK